MISGPWVLVRAIAALALLSCSETSPPSNSSDTASSSTVSSSTASSSSNTAAANTASGSSNTAAANTGASMGGASGTTVITTAASSSSSGTIGTGTASGAGAGGSGATTGGRGGGSSTQGVSDPEAIFTNPLNASHGSDPWMTYHAGYYYLAATTWGDTLTMKRGRTIAELKEAEPTVIWQDENPARCCNMWAPEFYLIDGPNGQRWYHYYTAGDGDDLGTQRSHVLESEGSDPMGPYHYQGQLMNTWAIDGSLLLHAGERYFMFSAWDGPTQNAWIIAMSDPWTTIGNRTLLTAPTYAWEQEGSDSVNEGPAALYHEGRVFVTYSASQCADPGYKLGLLELLGDNPLDPSAWWKSPEPVFQTANGAYGSGHNGFFTSPDGSQNWLVYHATTNALGSCWTDRTTRIQPFSWESDGLPNFGEPLPLSTEIIVPSAE